mmetsp:Transcript_9254/g.27698  ORF Transcript_9254/g.27698 Transcript_9254/m.27698 type:complete len:304 (-) Transcript_9254:862-1773(-)
MAAVPTQCEFVSARARTHARRPSSLRGAEGASTKSTAPSSGAVAASRRTSATPSRSRRASPLVTQAVSERQPGHRGRWYHVSLRGPRRSTGGAKGSLAFSSTLCTASGRRSATVTKASRDAKKVRPAASSRTSSTCGSAWPGAKSVSCRSAGSPGPQADERTKAPTDVPGEAQSVSGPAPAATQAAKGPGSRWKASVDSSSRSGSTGWSRRPRPARGPPRPEAMSRRGVLSAPAQSATAPGRTRRLRDRPRSLTTKAAARPFAIRSSSAVARVSRRTRPDASRGSSSVAYADARRPRSSMVKW